MKPKILAISLGGTLFMSSEDDGTKKANTLGDNYNVFGDFPQIAKFCTPHFKELSSIDSSNLQPENWEKLAHLIINNREYYDGFVVLQGTDTLSYSSAALSFALLGLNKPVVLTGAQKAKDDIASDAHNNVTNAFQIASLKYKDTTLLKEVVVVFGSRIIRGTRVRKYSERDLEAFDSVNIPTIGRIRLGIKFNRELLIKPTKINSLYGTKFDADVNMIYLYPGIKPDVVFNIGKSSSALILAAFGAGNIPCIETNLPQNKYSLEKAIKELTKLNIPVVITTQCVTGQAEFSMYEAGHAAIKAGAIIANDMTPETAYVKMSWLLANFDLWPKDAKRAAKGGPGWIEGVKKVMITDLAGDITENPVINSPWV